MPVAGAKTGAVGTATDDHGSDDGAADREDGANGGAVVVDDCSGGAGRVAVVSRRRLSNPTTSARLPKRSADGCTIGVLGGSGPTGEDSERSAGGAADEAGSCAVESSCRCAQSSILPSRTPRTKRPPTSRRMKSGCHSKLPTDSSVGEILDRWNTEHCGEESCTAATASAQSEYERSPRRGVCLFQKKRSCCDGHGVEDDRRTNNAPTNALTNWSGFWMYHG